MQNLHVNNFLSSESRLVNTLLDLVLHFGAHQQQYSGEEAENETTTKGENNDNTTDNTRQWKYDKSMMTLLSYHCHRHHHHHPYPHSQQPTQHHDRPRPAIVITNDNERVEGDSINSDDDDNDGDGGGGITCVAILTGGHVALHTTT